MIYEFMERFGPIEKLDLKIDPNNKRYNKGFGFIKFWNLKTTNYAL